MRFYLSCVSTALAYQIDMSQGSMREIEVRDVVVEQDEEVTMRFDVKSGTGYTWISNLSEEGKTVRLVDRWTESNSELAGGPASDFWKVNGVTEGSADIMMAYVRPWTFDAAQLEQPMATWGEKAEDAYQLKFNVVSKVGRVDVNSEKDTNVYGSEGDYWRITLHENPSTGFRWNIKADGPVKVIQTNFEPA